MQTTLVDIPSICAYLFVVQKLTDFPMLTATKLDDNTRDEEALDDGSDEDEFLTGKKHKPFSVDSDDESHADQDDSDDEAEE